MLPIGFSTQNFHRSRLPLAQRVQMCLDAGASAIEIGLSTEWNFRPGSQTPDPLPATAIKLLDSFSYVSLHAPKFNDSQDLHRILRDLTGVLSQIPSVRAITLHPDLLTRPDLEALSACGLPMALENMDKQKTDARDPEYFARIESLGYEFPYVLDVQHCFEHDPQMGIARAFYDRMAPRLAHLHVSGERGLRNHVPVHEALNQSAIADFVRCHASAPIILEGEFPRETPQMEACMRRELSFWADCLSE